ncbi:unnamed protein product [Didymodactylos carnosus]|uniref:TIR domain-containing protein n=1 Tax=Didymodactylos carnosus TaxID=1234261 RepID=A0A814M8I7_9BILA|nr:unnamed protein product [Didymodactylos carnosus]CAF1076124.1 unnamed protein product [Didymodactylos carnosus]CAF3657851.1 unnamed protein product [Didymodactylos carnosus]CAF3842606.1 unnamed protein product [Didymodactylos carnosus]
MPSASQRKNDEFDRACDTFHSYKYHFNDKKVVEKVQQAFTQCQKQIQKSGISDATTNALQRIHTALSFNHKEFERTPWNPALDTFDFFVFIQDFLLSMIQKVSEKQNQPQDTTKMKIKCFDLICSLLDLFDFKFFFDDKFLYAIKQCLSDVKEHQYTPDDFRYEQLAILFGQIYTVMKFKIKYGDVCQKLYPAATTLILQCVLNYFQSEFDRFYDEEKGRSRRTEGDAKRRLILNIFPEYLLLEGDDIVSPALTTAQLDCLCQTLFNWSRIVFDHVFSQTLNDYTLSSVLVRFIRLMNRCIPSVYFRRCTRKNLPLVENLLRLLHTPLFIKEITDWDDRFKIMVLDHSIQENHYDLVIAAAALLYNLSVESIVVDRLRTLKDNVPLILSVLHKQCKTKNAHTTTFHCETLIGLMNDDIDKLSEPKELATSYVKYMSKTMSKQNQSFEKVRLSDVIIHLKVFIQNEEVKTEVVAQDGLTLLTTCAYDNKFDMASIQYSSMELIWSIIFNLSAAQLLRANKVFVDYVVDLTKAKTDKPNDHVLKSVAEGVDWEMKRHVVKEEKRKEAKKPLKFNMLGVPVDQFGRQLTKEQRLAMEPAKDFKFDLMISYCHKDSELCIKVYEGLHQATNARIWIDRNEMFGSLTERMSEAIEHSRIILICYSNAYKESPNCQSECTYANELKREIIPLRMEANYRPNGWLKVILGDRVYVDFLKNGFDTGFTDLIKQLQRYDKKYRDTMNVKQAERPVNASDSAAAQSQKKMKEGKQPPPPPPKDVMPKSSRAVARAHCSPSPPPLLDSRTTRAHHQEHQRARSNVSATAEYESRSIQSWTQEDVDTFFYAKQIEPMLQLLGANYNGRYLIRYYQRLVSQENAYQIAKEELKDLHQISLPFNMFVTFTDEIELYLGQTNN